MKERLTMEVSSSGNANVDKDMFLRLFTTQLKNQSPLDPLKGHEFAAQLAQFSSLEQLTNLNTSFTGVLESQKEMSENFSTSLSGLERTQQILGGGSLIGKTAEYTKPDSPHYPREVSKGKIEKISIHDKDISVVIDKKEIPLSEIRGIVK
jgi:flagellar basal-body rod modification protein FlgD